jgi:hypothetical protein
MSIKRPQSESDAESGPYPTDLALHTQSEAARILRLSERSLERHRLQGTGPRYASLGRRIVYARADLFAWVQDCSRRSTSEPRR